MANTINLIFPLEKRFIEKKNLGQAIQYVLDSRFLGSAIPLRQILELVCVFTQDGECKFFRLTYGPENRPIKVIIDKGQYDDLMELANS